MIASIHRDISNSECVMGRLYVDAVFQGYTIERPWLDNQNDISCVPDGVYDVVLHDSPQHGLTVALVNPELNVHYQDQGEGRFLCLVAHVGNWAKNVQGCVALGKTRGNNMVGKSLDAINDFRDNVDLSMITQVVITSDFGIG